MNFRLAARTHKRDVLDNMEDVRRFIAQLAKRIEMTVINGPNVVSFKDLSGDPESGLSAYAIISESHISLHSWPEANWFYIEVTSCKPFKPEQAQAFTETWFGVKEVVAVTWDDFPVGPQIRRMDVTVGGGDDSVTSGFRSTQVIDR